VLVLPEPAPAMTRTELIHHLDHGSGKGALREIQVIFIGFWNVRPAITWEIRDHEHEVLCKRRRYPVPHYMRLRKSVQ
jgi:hypothetical protein